MAHAASMHMECMAHAVSIYMECMAHAVNMHMECMAHAVSMHVECMAHAVRMTNVVLSSRVVFKNCSTLEKETYTLYTFTHTHARVRLKPNWRSWAGSAVRVIQGGCLSPFLTLRCR